MCFTHREMKHVTAENPNPLPAFGNYALCGGFHCCLNRLRFISHSALTAAAFNFMKFAATLVLIFTVAFASLTAQAKLTAAQLAANEAELDALTAALTNSAPVAVKKPGKTKAARGPLAAGGFSSFTSFAYTLADLGTFDAPSLIQCSNQAWVVNCPTNVETYLLWTTNLLTEWKVLDDVTNGEVADLTGYLYDVGFLRLVTETNMYAFELLAAPSSEAPVESDIVKGWQLETGRFSRITNSPLTGTGFPVYRDAYVTVYYPFSVTNNTAPWPCARIYCSVPHGSGYVTYTNLIYMPTNSNNQVFHVGFAMSSVISGTPPPPGVFVTNGFIYYQPTLPIYVPVSCDTNCLAPPSFPGPVYPIMHAPFNTVVSPVMTLPGGWSTNLLPVNPVETIIYDPSPVEPPPQQPQAGPGSIHGQPWQLIDYL